MTRARALAVLAGSAALLLGAPGCGENDPGDSERVRKATLLLDFTPNGVHAGVYRTIERGYDRRAGIDLTVRVPGSSTDALKLLASGRADLAILDIHDLGIARRKNRDVVGVMALVQRPLAAVLAEPKIRRPRDLEGKRVGVTGLPSDDAVLKSIVRGDGGDPSSVRATTIGFEAVTALLAKRVSAATAFWNAEGVALRRRSVEVSEFRVDDYGAPRYPELVVATTRDRLRRDRDLIVRVVTGLLQGQRDVIEKPATGAAALVRAQPGLKRAAIDAQLRALRPVLMDDARRTGLLDPAVLEQWMRWDVRFGILERPIDTGRAFDVDVVVEAEPRMAQITPAGG